MFSSTASRFGSTPNKIKWTLCGLLIASLGLLMESHGNRFGTLYWISTVFSAPFLYDVAATHWHRKKMAKQANDEDPGIAGDHSNP